MKTNCLYMPMVNEYGSNYGTERIDFPEKEIDPEMLVDELPDGILKDDIVSSKFNRLTWKNDKENEKRPSFTGSVSFYNGKKRFKIALWKNKEEEKRDKPKETISDYS